MRTSIKKEQYQSRYAHVLDGDAEWAALAIPAGDTFAWDDASTYIRKPSFFDNLGPTPAPLSNISGARVLAVLGDSVTTDHISPAGDIAQSGPAALYLKSHGVAPRDFNSYGSRRGNHEVMMRGTFANIRLKNLLAPGTQGGVTRYLPSGEQMSIYDASMRYQHEQVPLVVIAGKEYGTGSSRDWAAKGVNLLGVRAVICQTFERIHRSNLVGMGVLPLEFVDGASRESLGLTGEEVFAIRGIGAGLAPKKKLTVEAGSKTFQVLARLDTPQEVEYYLHGGILQYVLRQIAG
jgi:aconitate hydratase